MYLSGLDHEAHINGLGGYKSYFTDTVDGQIKNIVAMLKAYDEFDNKIFIIVSDHGETQMPVDLTYEGEVWVNEGEMMHQETQDIPIDMSCSLKTNMQDDDVRESELKNNNLHIWELAEVLKHAGIYKGSVGLDFSVMAPQEIASLYNTISSGAKPDTSTANVVAALNGPMAHLYLKNRATNSWNSPRMVEDIGYLSELLRLSISSNKLPSNLNNIFSGGIFEKVIPISVGIKGLLNSVDFILVRRNNNYEVFYGIKTDGTDILSAPLDSYAELGSSLYVKALKRINDMKHPDRSGDIVLVMRDIAGSDAISRFTTAYACKAWHGSLNPSDSYVPMILSYPGGNKSEVDNLMQNVFACPNGQCEGNWNAADIIKSIIRSQY